MTKLTEKLKSTQAGSLEGKVIEKAVIDAGVYYLLFDDGEWIHTNWGHESVGEILWWLEDPTRPEDHPFVELGIATIDEIEEHWTEAQQEQDAEAKERRRRQYESLKAEFKADDALQKMADEAQELDMGY